MGWLLGIVDEGRIQDLEGAVLDLTKPLPPDAFARYDGVIAGIAKVRGTEAAVFAQEPSYKGGSMGLGHTRRLEKLVSVATDEKLPIIGFYDSGGVRVQEGGHSLEEASALVGQLIKARDVVPVISAVMGTVSGAAAYAAYMGDAILMIRGKSSLFVWGPGVARAETNTEVTAEELGGADVQSANGTASHVLDDERECLETAARLLGYFRGKGSGQPLEATLSTPQLITQTFDPGSFVEFRGSYARSAVTGLALLEGKTVGVVSSNKEVMRGFLDVDACRKISRFASMCNSLRIPLVTLLDSPGVYPGPEQEKAGVIRASGEAIKEYASSGSPKVAVITGEAYGGAFVGFTSKALGSKKVFAYPTARISVLSLPAYSEIFLKRRVDALAGEAKQTELDRGSTDYLKQMDPSKGVKEGYIDEIIDPSQTRAKLVEAFKGAGVF